MTDYFLSYGSHKTAADGRCAMEWVAYLAGEPHSDSPQCVCEVLTRFCIAFNDALPDEQRQKLRPYLARTIGTRGDGLAEQRSWLAMDWLIRTYTPTWLSLAGLDDAAERLRALPPVLTSANLTRAMDDLKNARSEAYAAGVAAWDAARDAARAAELQASVFDLLDRMLPTEVIQIPVAADAEQVCGSTDRLNRPTLAAGSKVNA